jgi:hypothetical protein
MNGTEDLKAFQTLQLGHPLDAERHLRPKSDSLCTRCVKINLDAILSREHKTQDGLVVRNMGLFSNWAINSCSMCHLLASTLSDPDLVQSGNHRILSSFSSHRIQYMGWSAIKTGMISMGTGFLVPQPEGTNSIRILKEESLDFEIFNTWLKFCQSMHTKTCKAETSPSVPFLKLIDCETRTIVPTFNYPYVALSYVWGSTSGDENSFGTLPESLPNTIEDAIVVTRKLGFRYLWIDRYCINRKSPEECSVQVQKMNLIYQNSEVCIIAAAGQDPFYGLPGVGRRNRKRQPRGKVDRHFMVSALVNPQVIIAKSCWFTRAWTYQEALLSRRRLVFTDEQVYFECYGMYCCETLNFPLQDLHTKNCQRFKASYCDGNKIGLFPKGVGSRAVEVIERIQEYSQKSLSNQWDILNGILGILNAFQTSVHRIRHIWGVPIITETSKLPQPASAASDSYQFIQATDFLYGLWWQVESPATRRPDFPSWSWTGWFGPVHWDRLIDRKNFRVDPSVTLKVELRDGRILDWENFQKSYNKLNQQSVLSTYIHISAWTSPIRVLDYERGAHEISCGNKYPKYIGRIHLDNGGYLELIFNSTADKPLPSRSCIAIHVAEKIPGREEWLTDHAFIIACQVGDTMERVGFGWLCRIFSNQYRADGTEDARYRGILMNSGPREGNLVRSWQEIRLG